MYNVQSKGGKKKSFHLEIAQVLLRNGADACQLDFVVISWVCRI